MDILKRAKDAIAMIALGRSALTEIADAIKDGTVAVHADTVAEIDRLLEDERAENRATNEAITAAIADHRQRHG